MATEQTTMPDADEQDMPCGENSCRCYCTGEGHTLDCGCTTCTGHGPHACGCDCPRYDAP